MPWIETVDELTEDLANLLGIYNQGMQLVGVADARLIADTGLYDHAETCQCRGCWTAAMAHRIRTAVAHDALLKVGRE